MEVNIEKIENKENQIKDEISIETHLNCNNIYSHTIHDFCILDQLQNTIDPDIVREHFKNQGKLSEKQCMKILDDSVKIFKQEPNLIKVNSPCYIIGDIHGQFYDLINILGNFDLSKDVLVFLGDYVDRGAYSTEVYLYLCCLKIYYKDNIILLRGNHESKAMTEKFTFKNECLYKYSEEVYKLFLYNFNHLPLASVILEKIYCSHGGISPNIKILSDIDKLERFSEIKVNTPICDILWSDPHPEYGKNQNEIDFMVNTTRKCSYFYSYKGITNFLKENKLLCVVRGHEVSQEGFKVYKSFNDIPSVITIFSAPNYCDSYGNKGSILFFDGTKMKICTFEEVPHPHRLPNNMDGINWSFPFVAEKISEFYLDLLKNIETSGTIENLEKQEISVEHEITKSQNFAVAMALIRSERENLHEIEDEESEMISLNVIKTSEMKYKDFEKSKDSDVENESLPHDQCLKEGISMKISDSLAPKITREVSKLDLDSALDHSEIIVDNNTDKAKIKITERKKKSSGCFGCCD